MARLDWEQLEQACRSCQRCALADGRHNVVFGVGPRDAEVMCIGEGPGENEDLQGGAFVGRGGKLLDDMLELIDLDRSRNVYIANIVKCRPPQNRDPLNTEQDACIGYLRNQVALIRPKIIVCLGRVAAMRLIREDLKISREHGQWVERSGVWMTALYHPAAILRDPSKRPVTFDDLKSLQSKIRQVCSSSSAFCRSSAVYRPSSRFLACKPDRTTSRTEIGNDLSISDIWGRYPIRRHPRFSISGA